MNHVPFRSLQTWTIKSMFKQFYIYLIIIFGLFGIFYGTFIKLTDVQLYNQYHEVHIGETWNTYLIDRAYNIPLYTTSGILFAIVLPLLIPIILVGGFIHIFFL